MGIKNTATARAWTARAALLTTLFLVACATATDDCRPKPGEPVPSTLLCGATQSRGGT